MNSTWPKVCLLLSMLTMVLSLSFAVSEMHQRQELVDLLEEQSMMVERATSKAVLELQSLAGIVLDLDEFWPSTDTTTFGSEIQSILLASAQSNGLDLVQYRQQPVREFHGFERISATVELNGELESVVSLVGQMKARRPALMVESMMLRSRPEREQIEGATQVTSQISFWGLAAKNMEGNP